MKRGNDTPDRDARRTRKRGARRPQGGFTLIETSVALLLMMVAGLSIASVFSFAVSYNKGANGRAAAQALAQRQMEFLRKSTYDQVVPSTQVMTVPSSPGVAGAGLRYSVVTAVCNDGSAACGGSTSVKRVTITSTPLNAGTGWASRPVVLVTLRSNTTLGPNFH